MNLRPTIAEIVPGYTAVGFPKSKSVSLITGARLSSGTARGKGSKAKRRAYHIYLAYLTKPDGTKDVEELAERFAEGRFINHNKKSNYHDE